MRKTMKKYILCMMSLFLILSVLIIPASYTAAAETATQAPVTIQHVYDEAGLLSTSELSDIEEKCTTNGIDSGVDIMILTSNDSSVPAPETYIENFEDQLPVGDRVYLYVNMGTRDVFIEGYGLAEDSINSSVIDNIISDITPSLTAGNYYDAFKTYIDDSAIYLSKTSIFTSFWFQLLIAIIIGAITVAIMASNSGGRMTAGGGNYIDQNHSGLIGRRDDYIRTTVTRIRKPQNNSTGGVSAGGRSHSSGGGKF